MLSTRFLYKTLQRVPFCTYPGCTPILASQRDSELSKEVIANTSTKIVLMVDQTEVKAVSNRFRFSPNIVGQLQPLEALVRMGTEGIKTSIKPFYERYQE
jgi:hypothetical protein